jgi:hypothetical protein
MTYDGPIYGAGGVRQWLKNNGGDSGTSDSGGGNSGDSDGASDD